MSRLLWLVAMPTVLLASLLAGCDASVSPPDLPAPDAVVVNSILRADLNRQGVLVTNVTAPEETTPPYRLDADVSVGGVRFPAVPRDSLRGSFDGPDEVDEDLTHISTDLELQRNQTYDLRVEVDGTVITGQTRVPGSFSGFTEALRIVWTKSAGAAQYLVTVTYAEPERGGWFLREFTTTDTSITVTPDDQFIAGPHQIRVEAHDANLVARRNGERGAGLDRDQGLFGALAAIEGEVPLVPEDTAAEKTTLHPIE